LLSCSQSNCQVIGNRLPYSIARNKLKCESCEFKWLNITTEMDLNLLWYDDENLCSICINYREKRRRIRYNYFDYFNKTTEMWDMRHKELYVDLFESRIKCCICNPNNNGEVYAEPIVHYSLAPWEEHQICSFCFDKELGNRNVVYNCKCGIDEYWKEPESESEAKSSDSDSYSTDSWEFDRCREPCCKYN
jgi:hypothetical protein